MKEVVIKNYERSMWGGHGHAFLQKQKDTFVIAEDFQTCRAYMADSVYAIKNADKKPYHKFNKNSNVNINKGLTHIGVQFHNEEQKNRFIKNLPYLHKKESKAKVRKTKLYASQHPLTLVAEGGSFWKKKCWTLLLYTFYLKRLAYAEIEGHDEAVYWNALKKDRNEEIFLSHVKSKVEDFTNVHNNIHGASGFVAIAIGMNETMRKLLGITKV